MRYFINGADAIVKGALDAGCDFFAGYPITPATGILLTMSAELLRVGGIAIQAEDEIAALGFCIGAVLAGRRAMTATSGPGISLYSENIGAAIMGEVPLVIVDCQRVGPATGAATSGAQGDIQFLRWGTSGGYPVIVLAPATLSDCYRLTLRAFDLAERFRLPVFLATDKEMVLSSQTVQAAELKAPPVRSRNYAAAEHEFIPYAVNALSDVPAMSPLGGPHIVRFTTSSHDPDAYLTKDPGHVGRLNQHLAAKIEAHQDEISMVKHDYQAGADTLIISYGITAQACMAAVQAARAKGRRVSLLVLYSLWPVPEEAILAALQNISRVLVVELNLGQYRREIERLARDNQTVIGVHRVDGELITPAYILKQGGLE